MVSFENFSKTYGHTPVLSIPSLTLAAGIYWVKGANGSGKSTLLRSIAGLLHMEGKIILNEHLTLKDDSVAYRHAVSFAEAEPLFPEFLTGAEMIRLFAAARNAAQGEEQPYLESMQMLPYIHEPLAIYSSGMLKKLSLVLAFLGTPKIILLDEPLITLDTASIATLYEWISRKHADEKTGFLLSSHQPVELENIPVHTLLVENQTLIVNPAWPSR